VVTSSFGEITKTSGLSRELVVCGKAGLLAAGTIWHATATIMMPMASLSLSEHANVLLLLLLLLVVAVLVELL
jgi:hypothetical protein